METAVLEAIEAIRPALQSDGGDMRVLNLDEETGVLDIELLGACGSCPMSTDDPQAGRRAHPQGPRRRPNRSPRQGHRFRHRSQRLLASGLAFLGARQRPGRAAHSSARRRPRRGCPADLLVERGGESASGGEPAHVVRRRRRLLGRVSPERRARASRRSRTRWCVTSATTGQRVGVLAIDPSSPFTGGAILGDRVRMQDHATDAGVFIRSMATRGHVGGLALATPEAARVLAAVGYPLVLIETVGVGQVEVEIAGAADTTVVVVNPGWGDAVQANKAGLLEVADVFVINKADRPGVGRGAPRPRSDARHAHVTRAVAPADRRDGRGERDGGARGRCGHGDRRSTAPTSVETGEIADDAGPTARHGRSCARSRAARSTPAACAASALRSGRRAVRSGRPTAQSIRTAAADTILERSDST